MFGWIYSFRSQCKMTVNLREPGGSLKMQMQMKTRITKIFSINVSTSIDICLDVSLDFLDS